MRLYDQFIYFLFIYLIHSNKWILVESSESSATPPASSGGDSSTLNPGQGATSTLPTGGATDSSNKTGVELSLKATAATNEFDYNKDDKVVTYTAKDKYAFKSVKTKKGGCSGCCGTDITIWDAKDANEYASKVVLYGKGKKDKIVTIHMPNDTKKSYKKDKNNPWSEYTGPLPSNGKSGGSSATPTDNTNEKTATVDIKKAVGDGYKSDRSGYIFTYFPRAGYCFNEVKEDSKDIWKTDKKDEYSKKVKADFAKNIVTIHIGPDGGSTKVFKKGSDGNWKEEGQDSTKKSGTGGSGGGATQTSPTSGGGTTGTDGSGGGGTTPANQTAGGGTTGTDGSGGGGTQQSTPTPQ